MSQNFRQDKSVVPTHSDYLIAVEDLRDLLKHWRWLIGPKLQLLFVTKFGDAILTDPADGSAHFLDTIDASCAPLAASASHLPTMFSSVEAMDHYLSAARVDAAARGGLLLRPGECYWWQIHPMIGGPLRMDNVTVLPIAAQLSISGQLLRQIKDLPIGTEIIATPPTESKPPPASAQPTSDTSGHESLWKRILTRLGVSGR